MFLGGGAQRTHAGGVVRLDDGAAIGVLSADGAIVGALRPIRVLQAVGAVGPAVRRHAVGLEEGVLLLDAEPRLLALHFVHDRLARDARVGRDGLAHALGRVGIGLVAVAQHEDVGAVRAERVAVDRARHEQDLRVGARRLLGRGAVKVPDGQVLGRRRRLGERLGFAAELVVAADPDVLSLNHARLRFAKT